MAHPNIEQRREFVKQMHGKINKRLLMQIASEKFQCSKSAIFSDMIALTHEQSGINKTIYPNSRLKKRIYERDGGICQYCGDDKPNEFVIDHVMPASLGGYAIESNLVLCCASCNVKKKGRTATPNNVDLLNKLRNEGR